MVTEAGASESESTAMISRRRLLGASGALGAAGAIGISAAGRPAPALARDASAGAGALPHALGVLGADYDQNLTDISGPELHAAGARWLRGFYPTPQADAGPIADDAGIQAVLAASGQGYGTVLNLQFPYGKMAMPAPGSDAMAVVLARLDKILPAVMNQVDILVVGNEPFIESMAADRNDGTLNTFYEAVAQHIIAFGQANFGSASTTLLYMGAMNRLDLPANQTAATDRWMAFTQATAAIEGVDIHPHVPSPAAVQPFLDYILPRMRADQTFVVTEFSLIGYWMTHLQDPISPQFAAARGFDPATLVWQVIAAAIDTPFTQAEWNDFLATSTWFQSHKNFLRNQVRRFRQTGQLAVATYEIRQGIPIVTDFGPTSAPWVLNTVYDNHMVQTAPDGLPGRNVTWFSEFRALQNG